MVSRLSLLVLLFAITACNGITGDKRIVTGDMIIASPDTSFFGYNENVVQQEIKRLSTTDSTKGEAVKFLNAYYLRGGKPLVVGHSTAASVADTVIAIIRDSRSHGLNPETFSCSAISDDLTRLDSLWFDSLNTVNNVLARLEYNLSKAFLSYSAGMRYGFVRPQRLFNNIDKRPRTEDPTGKRFRVLFDTKTSTPDSAFFSLVSKQLSSENLSTFAKSIIPTDSLYQHLKNELAKTDSIEYRDKLMCNMERCRWREASPFNDNRSESRNKSQTSRRLHDSKHIIVNIPAQHLYAFGGDTVLDMRIVCGTKRNKTPLLNSQIERIEVNPLWLVPNNIIKGELAYHAGDSAYFAEDNYVITHKETGDTINPKETTFAMLRSGKYRIAQERGPGNSLGRVVFRFPNPFSVFLHDTNSPRAFRREVRTLSHGCVRLERPLNMALYVLEDEDEWTLDKVRISMGFKPESEKGKKWIEDYEKDVEERMAQGDTIIPPRYHSLIRHKELKSNIPLSITYYTIFFDENGKLQSYPDRYGYDKLISEAMKR